MSITPKNKSSKTVSERERFIGFVYVLTLFIVITGAKRNFKIYNQYRL